MAADYSAPWPPRADGCSCCRRTSASTTCPDRPVPADDDWYAAVRAPEGPTLIREVPSDAPDGAQRWIGLYGDDPDDLDLPGMPAAVVGPLGSAGVPVFVASTHASDLVLVPADRYDEAAKVLRAAGHEVVSTA